jgi:predicted DNA-binding WGR domain protein
VAAPVAAPPAPARKKVVVTVPAAPPVAPPSGEPERVRRFLYEAGERTNYWETGQRGAWVRFSFGTLGGKQQTKEQTFTSADAAQAAIAELVADKLDDGFIEVDPATQIPLKPVAAAAALVKPAAPEPPGDRAAGARHFEFVEGTSNKFWEVWVEGHEMRTRYGRIGSKGTVTIKTYPDEAGAQKAMEKIIGEKTGKGYVEKP